MWVYYLALFLFLNIDDPDKFLLHFALGVMSKDGITNFRNYFNVDYNRPFIPIFCGRYSKTSEYK